MASRADIDEIHGELSLLRTDLQQLGTDLRSELGDEIRVLGAELTGQMHREFGTALAIHTRTLAVAVIAAISANSAIVLAAVRLG
ncbi:hypothetical protein BH24ACT3_BH24ACT3_17600 [soil metagenome]